MLTLKNAAGVDVAYEFYRNNAGTSTMYIGEDHSDLSVDKIDLISSSPSRVSKDYGNRRSRANLQRGVEVSTPESTLVVKNAKLETLASVPVGMTVTQFTELCARQASLLSNPTYVRALFMLGQTEINA